MRDISHIIHIPFINNHRPNQQPLERQRYLVCDARQLRSLVVVIAAQSGSESILLQLPFSLVLRLAAKSSAQWLASTLRNAVEGQRRDDTRVASLRVQMHGRERSGMPRRRLLSNKL